jgi:hypothetical protein
MLKPLEPARVKEIELDLYLKFAGLDGSEASVKAFADANGPLGLGIDEGLVWQPKGPQTGGELLTAWKRQIEEMNKAVEPWRLSQDARGGDTGELSQGLVWHTDQDGSRSVELLGRRVEDPEEVARLRKAKMPTHNGSYFAGSTWVTHGIRPGTPLDSLLNSDPLIALATYRLIEMINAHGRVSAMLDWELGSDRRPRKPAATFSSLGLTFWPHNLISALWLQLAQAVAERKRCRRCWVCSTWMLVSALGGRRAERRTCSMKCRKQLSLRRGVAIKRINQGESRRSIAREFRITEQTLNEWLDTAEPEQLRPARRAAR